MFAEETCREFYADNRGRPGVAPGVYFVRGAFPGEGVVGRVVVGLWEAVPLFRAACACE